MASILLVVTFVFAVVKLFLITKEFLTYHSALETYASTLEIDNQFLLVANLRLCEESEILVQCIESGYRPQ